MFISADDYDRFMGRYSVPLAREFSRFAYIESEQTVLDVGCGTGALTGELVRLVGGSRVSAVDPSPQFVEHVRGRLPGVDVRVANAEELPYPADWFDAVLAQLVVHFMSDPVKGLFEMKRTARRGGVVTACVWNFTRDETPLTVFWHAARQLDLAIETEVEMPGAEEGDLGDLFEDAGLTDIREKALDIEVTHPDFEDWWDPFTFGVGPAGAYVASLTSEAREELREVCRKVLSDGPIVLRFTAWAVRGIA